MPASRKARAITFAPRSCPSRPGFATSTRIFVSAIANHLTTDGTEVHRGGEKHDNLAVFLGDPRCRRWLKSFDVEASPHGPPSHAAIRSPGFGDFFHNFRLRQFALLVVFPPRHLHSIVARGQHIRTSP